MMRLVLTATLVLAACAQTYDYDPATAGDPEGGGRELKSKTSSQFLRTVYADLLGRTPETYDFTLSVNGGTPLTIPLDEEAMLTIVLDGLGDPGPIRSIIVNGLLHSAEIVVPDKASVDAHDYIRQQFDRLLGREPNIYELDGFADEWASDPAVGPRTIIRAITGSREYQSQ